MKCLKLFSMINSSCSVSLRRGIQTGTVLMGRTRNKRGVPPRVNYEPGLRHREAAMGEEYSEFSEDFEGEDISEDFDMSNIGKVYKIDKDEQMQEKIRLSRIITAKKYFKGPQQPMTLTCNERECIRYLHKSDPFQWDVKTLSESFPAMPEAIKKVLKGKFRISPELKKRHDQKVQKNWELLEQGKLDAEPEVLEHLKKFINRREVLLEQIKNSKFYLPEVKEEPIWNNGEMSGILAHYEKAVQKLVQNQQVRNVKMIGDGSENESKSSLDKVHEQIENFTSKRYMKGKESFSLSGMIQTYSKEVTLAELEKNLLNRADKKKPLKVVEKAIVESVLGQKTNPQYANPESNVCENKSFIPAKTEQDMPENNSEMKEWQSSMYSHKENLKKLMMNEKKNDIVLPDNKTKFIKSDDLGYTLNKLGRKPDIATPSQPERLRSEIDESDPERLKREEQYFDNQVKDIEKTSFWNSSMTNQERVLLEEKKAPLGGPDIYGRGNVFSRDVYPERIKIPEDKKGSGLTFRVKDCFYDDDGEFLYRVPGMVK